MKLVDGEPHKLSLEEKLVFLNNITQSNFLDLKDLCSTKNMGYSINEPEFDMQKFSGRFKSFLKVSNPLHAFYSNRRIKEFQLLIKVQKRDEERYFKMTGTRKMIVPKEKVRLIRIAKTVISTAVNPDSGKNIFWSMRMSSFLPFNLPISFGLIITPPTPFNTILW